MEVGGGSGEGSDYVHIDNPPADQPMVVTNWIFGSAGLAVWLSVPFRLGLWGHV